VLFCSPSLSSSFPTFGLPPWYSPSSFWYILLALLPLAPPMTDYLGPFPLASCAYVYVWSEMMRMLSC
jgi:hypothetical protein